jgi:FkbM family methyltransferase
MLAILRFIFNHPLSRQQKLRALWRFVAWQCRCLLTGNDRIYPWVNQVRFHVRKGEVGLTGNIYTGLHEFEDMAFLLHFLRDGDLFVDVGTNAGSYTLLASGVVGAKTIAFEPVPATFRRLQRNVQLNAIAHRVDCRNLGVGAGPGTLSFSANQDTTNHVLLAGEDPAGSIGVEVVSLDIAIKGLPCPGLIKIDVEGFETPVIEGAAGLLSNPLLAGVIMELNGSGAVYGFDESRIIQIMQDHGFSAFRYDPWTRCLHRLAGRNPDAGNTLFLRNLPFIQERIAGAAPFRVFGMTI